LYVYNKYAPYFSLVGLIHCVYCLLVYGAAYTRDLVCGANQLHVYNKYAPYISLVGSIHCVCC